MTTRLLLLCALLAPLGAATEGEQLLASYDSELARLVDAYRIMTGRAADTYGQSALRIDAAAVKDLTGNAAKLARAGDTESARLAWLEVLRIDLQNAEARRYFQALGSLDAALDQALQPAAAAAGSADILGSVEGAGTAAPGSHLPEPLGKPVRQRAADLAAAKADFHKAEAKIREQFASAESKLRDKVLKRLERLAGTAARRGELPAATADWRRVLRLDRDHAEAVAWFSGQNQLDSVLADLPPEPSVEGLLGPVPEPSAGFFGLRGEGRVIGFVRRDDGGMDQAIAARLEELGFVVEDYDTDDDEETRARQQDRFALILAVQTGDSIFGTVSSIADYSPTPLLVVHPKLLLATRLLPDEAQYEHQAELRHITIADPRHPMAAGLKGEVEILTPEAAQHEELVELAAFERGKELGASAQVIATMDGVPCIVAWERGSPFADPPSERIKDKATRELTASSGRVVGFFLFTHVPPQYVTRDGWRLFDASLAWLLR